MAKLSDKAAREVSAEITRGTIAIRESGNRRARAVASQNTAAAASLRLGINAAGRVTEETVSFPVSFGGGGGLGTARGRQATPSAKADLTGLSEGKAMALLCLEAVAIVAIVAGEDGRQAYREMINILGGLRSAA